MKQNSFKPGLWFLGVLVLALLVGPGTSAFASHLDGYAAPTGLSANVSGDDVTLAWDTYPLGNFPTGCNVGREIWIFREDNGSGTFNQITAITATATTYTDETLADGNYNYRLRARCNVPGGPPNHSNNLSAFSSTAGAVVNTGLACAGPPVVEGAASPLHLWPPNGKLVPITVTGTVTPQANCSMPENIMYSTWDEYGELSSVYPVLVPLVNGTYNFQVSLEASRRGDDRDGRLYQIQLDTADGGMADIDVIVPHDQRKK